MAYAYPMGLHSTSMILPIADGVSKTIRTSASAAEALRHQRSTAGSRSYFNRIGQSVGPRGVV